MTERSIRTALISSDRSFRELVKDVFLSHEAWTAPAIEIAAPFAAFGESEVRSIRQLRPELIILDLGEDPEMGIKLASFLSEATPGQRFVAVGPHLAPDLLLLAMRAGVADYRPRRSRPRSSAFASSSGPPAGKRPARLRVSSTPSTAPRAAPARPPWPRTSRSCSSG